MQTSATKLAYLRSTYLAMRLAASRPLPLPHRLRFASRELEFRSRWGAHSGIDLSASSRDTINQSPIDRSLHAVPAGTEDLPLDSLASYSGAGDVAYPCAPASQPPSFCLYNHCVGTFYYHGLILPLKYCAVKMLGLVYT